MRAILDIKERNEKKTTYRRLLNHMLSYHLAQ